MQSAFFKLSKVIPIEDAVQYMKEAIVHSYGAKDEDIVKMNYAAVDADDASIDEIEVRIERMEDSRGLSTQASWTTELYS